MAMGKKFAPIDMSIMEHANLIRFLKTEHTHFILYWVVMY